MRIITCHDVAPEEHLEEMSQASRIWRMVINLREDGIFDPTDKLEWAGGRTIEQAFKLCSDYGYEAYPIFDRHFVGTQQNLERSFHQRHPVMNIETIRAFCREFWAWKERSYPKVTIFAQGDSNEFDYLPTIRGGNNNNDARLEIFSEYYEGFLVMHQEANAFAGPPVMTVVGGISGNPTELGMVQIVDFMAGSLPSNLNVGLAIHGNGKSNAWLAAGINNIRSLNSQFRILVDEDTNLEDSALRPTSMPNMEARSEYLAGLGVHAYAGFGRWEFKRWGSFNTRGMACFQPDSPWPNNIADFKLASMAAGDFVENEEQEPEQPEPLPYVYNPTEAKAHANMIRRVATLEERGLKPSEMVKDEVFIRRYEEFRKWFSVNNTGSGTKPDDPKPEDPKPEDPKPEDPSLSDEQKAALKMLKMKAVGVRVDANGMWNADMWPTSPPRPGDLSIHEGPFSSMLEAVEWMESYRKSFNG